MKRIIKNIILGGLVVTAALGTIHAMEQVRSTVSYAVTATKMTYKACRWVNSFRGGSQRTWGEFFMQPHVIKMSLAGAAGLYCMKGKGKTRALVGMGLMGYAGFKLWQLYEGTVLAEVRQLRQGQIALREHIKSLEDKIQSNHRDQMGAVRTVRTEQSEGFRTVNQNIELLRQDNGQLQQELRNAQHAIDYRLYAMDRGIKDNNRLLQVQINLQLFGYYLYNQQQKNLVASSVSSMKNRQLMRPAGFFC